MSKVKGKIKITVGDSEYIYEMHSFIKNMLKYLKGDFVLASPVKNNSLMYYRAGIFFSYDEITDYELAAIGFSEPMMSDFTSYSNAFLLTAYSLGAGGKKSVSIKKTYKNSSSDTKTIRTMMLSAINSTGTQNIPFALDNVIVSVGPNQSVTFEYVFEFAKNFTESFCKTFMYMFSVDPSVVKNVQNTNTFNFYALSRSYSGLGVMIGSDGSQITGAEYALRAPISLNDYTKSPLDCQLISPSEGNKGICREVRAIQNISATNFTIREVAIYAGDNSEESIRMVLIKTLATPVVMAPGEIAEITIDIVLE